MANKKLKAHTIPGHHVATQLAARAEDLLKANDDILDEAADRLDALVREASYHQAGSREAALFHLSILSGNADLLAMKPRESEIERIWQMNRRLVESLATYLEAVTGVDRHQTGMRYYLGSGGDRVATNSEYASRPEEGAIARHCNL